jgi:hypothetical protein
LGKLSSWLHTTALSCSVPIALWNCTTGPLADRKNKRYYATVPPGLHGIRAAIAFLDAFIRPFLIRLMK